MPVSDKTIRDNIAFGKPAGSEAEIIQAGQLDDAHGFIRALSEGYDTPLASLNGAGRSRADRCKGWLLPGP
jgi:ATP-binding cassette subfamily B protein